MPQGLRVEAQAGEGQVAMATRSLGGRELQLHYSLMGPLSDIQLLPRVSLAVTHSEPTEPGSSDLVSLGL